MTRRQVRTNPRWKESSLRTSCTHIPPGLLKTRVSTGNASGNQKYDSIEYDAPAIQTHGSTAVLATKVVMKGATKGQPFNNQLRLLHIWVKQGGGKWNLVAHQTTRLP